MLKRAIYELKEFERKFGKNPTSKSKGMNTIQLNLVNERNSE